MATVIDSLMIELGLDTSKFSTAQKKSVDQLRKFDDQSTKTFKNTQRGVNDLGDGFTKTRDALLSLGTAIVGMTGFKDIIKDTTTTNANIGRTAQLFKMSATELDAWGQVMKSVGGDASDFQGSMQSIKQGLSAVQFGDAAILKPLAILGATDAVDIKTQKVDVLKLADAIKKFTDTYGEETAFLQAQAIGVNRELFMVLKEGSASVQSLYQEAEKGSGVTNKNTEAAAALQKKWGDVSRAMDAAKNEITDQLNPSMMELAKLTEASLRLFVEWDKTLNGGLTTTLAFAAAIGSLTGAMKLLGLAAPKWMLKSLGTAELIFHSGELNEGEKEILQKERERMQPRGGTPEQAKRLSDLESKYNLPSGMLDKIWAIESGRGEKMVSPKGATGHFQFMPSAAAEYGLSREDTFDFEKSSEAAAKKMSNLMKYYSRDIDKAVAAYNMGEGNLDRIGLENAYPETKEYLKKYHQGVPSSGASNFKPLPLGTPIGATEPGPESAGKPSEKALLNRFWERSVSDWKGYGQMAIDANNRAGQSILHSIMNLSNITQSMPNMPLGASSMIPNSGRGGSTIIETNIGKIDVNTQAIDAKGIAKDIGESIKTNQIVNAGMQGPR